MARRFLIFPALLFIAALGCGGSGTPIVPLPEGPASGAKSAQAAPPQAAQAETPETDAAAALRQACQYLWKQQGEDGAWHSEHYAVLRSGQALTPFVLHALLQVPAGTSPRPDGGVERALDFIRAHVNGEGALGKTDPDILEYPNYATAFGLRCLIEAGTADDKPLIDRMRAFLVAEQFAEQRGFQPEHPAYGGWGFGGTQPPGVTGHMDLAHVRYVLVALADCRARFDSPGEAADSPGTALDETMLRRAETFLRMVQRHPDDPRPQPLPPGEPAKAAARAYDGGFYFSPVVLAANKGRVAHTESGEPYWRSYATATCDGLLALLACEVPRDDERVAAAIAWLEKHPRLDYPEGVPEDHPEPWGEAITFYHFAVRTQVYDRLKWPGSWRSELAKLLAEQQQPDGSFVNKSSALMKEDDPLLCTALAVVTLSIAAPP